MIDFIIWLALGALVGWIASMIMKTDAQMGAVANIVVGVVGAFLGGFLSRTFLNYTPDQFSVGGLIVAIIGAVLLIWLVQMFTGRRTV